MVVVSHKPFSQLKTTIAQSEATHTNTSFCHPNTERKSFQAAVLTYFSPVSSVIYSNLNIE